MFQANKLNTVKKCLNEVLKYGGPFNARDLYPVRIQPLLYLAPENDIANAFILTPPFLNSISLRCSRSTP